MRTPRLSELPLPPPGKSGWPWTEESRPVPDRMTDGREWPRISIVTPSYNQGRFIEETIRSVLLQGYPNLEYLVIDGGSTDGSVEIIQKYSQWFTYWCSEKDRGQAHAINKGLDRVTGQIGAYLNSDDYYLPNALAHVGRTYRRFEFDVFVGRRWRGSYFKKNNRRNAIRPFATPFVAQDDQMRFETPQECVFWNQQRSHRLRFDESFHFCMDVWWFARIFSGAFVVQSSRPIGVFRSHQQSKSATMHDVSVVEWDRLWDELRDYLRAVPADFRETTRQAHRRTTLKTLVMQLVCPWRDYYFSYRHPSYLPAAVSCQNGDELVEDCLAIGRANSVQPRSR
ncbi:MAG TPA: glycosyltransferase family 2 protein [Verrucomicrobiae bacterium]|nr:glycosyltransferase family 2 protein [Verrucomicrobiae bacterium]